STLCDAAHADSARARLRAWREKDATARDAWLWYRTLVLDVDRAPAAAHAASQSAVPALRAAAIHALAACADPDALVALPGVVSPLPRDRSSLLEVEAWAQVLAGEPGRSRSPEFAAAVEALLPWVTDERVDPRTRLAIARGMARGFETDV